MLNPTNSASAAAVKQLNANTATFRSRRSVERNLLKVGLGVDIRLAQTRFLPRRFMGNANWYPADYIERVRYPVSAMAVGQPGRPRLC